MYICTDLQLELKGETPADLCVNMASLFYSGVTLFRATPGKYVAIMELLLGIDSFKTRTIITL